MSSDKNQWRDQARERRRNRSGSDREVARRANREHVRASLSQVSTVCAFFPLASEPLDPALLDDLVADDHRVLVPVTVAERPLDWVEYPCRTIPGPFGILAPDGRLRGPSALAEAEVVLVPAFAVDRTGNRLGRGGGHYDRSLALLDTGRAGPRLLAVLFDDELVDHLPAESHDHPVHAVVRPTTGITQLELGRLR